ncbi:small ribosomal subunit protein eS27y [Elaeis guineensis]|uniref:small ribosomal subunit protein eS27y n=1 Tax=Elaeis guineensis var. tenera TaxID=51953 RepID=UPI003C6DA85C
MDQPPHIDQTNSPALSPINYHGEVRVLSSLPPRLLCRSLGFRSISTVSFRLPRDGSSERHRSPEPPAELEKRRHKLKRLVQSPNSFFMDVKCQGCFNITTVFSHSQTVVVCGNCQTVLCQPTGGRARLTEGCSFRRKGD